MITLAYDEVCKLDEMLVDMLLQLLSNNGTTNKMDNLCSQIYKSRKKYNRTIQKKIIVYVKKTHCFLY